MAGTSLLVLLDDIAAVLDDVAVMTKIAAKKTAGVLGDDVALNAEQVSGVKADRELPVVWAVAKGSFRNKLILVPAALIISAFANGLILPLLMLGGLYLCFEGFEKLAHKFFHSESEDEAHIDLLEEKLADPATDMVEYEKEKIKGAIRTDFILSAEIIVLTLGVVSTSTFATQISVISGIALLMTVGVYGLVAAIVKLDDAGLHLSLKRGHGAVPGFQRWLGARLLAFAPWLMKALAVVGTAAMFMVGGGILAHGLHWVGEAIEHVAGRVEMLTLAGPYIAAVTPTLLQAAFGVVAGAIALAVVILWGKIRGK
jgi:predicted DNA repair protein MutK